MSWECPDLLPSCLRSGTSGLDGLRSLTAVKFLHIYLIFGVECPSSLCPLYEFKQFAGREKMIAFCKSLGCFFDPLPSEFSVPACRDCSFPIGWPCHSCWKSVGCRCLNSFLDCSSVPLTCLPSSSPLPSGFSVPACGDCGLRVSSIGADEGS